MSDPTGPRAAPAASQEQHHIDLRGLRVVMLSWRDTSNPEGGGAEVYLEQMALGLRDRGAQVTIFCAAHPGAAPTENREGIHYVRAGSKLSVYGRGMWALLSRRLGRPDVVVDVQNGLPFFSRLVTRTPVAVLVHHVHREQWPVVYPGIIGRVGWWIEHSFSPWLFRHSQYVAVSQATRRELVQLGVRGPRIAVVHNGTAFVDGSQDVKSATPTLCTVGRLVPHKQVEHAIDAVVELRSAYPGIVLRIVGDGWWRAELEAYAVRVGARDSVVFEGHVTEEQKSAIYAESWMQVMPSLKEGWGLVIGEAGMHRTPTIAYRSAGGVRESIVDGVSGLLLDDQSELVPTIAALLEDPERLRRLSDGALEVSHRFTWEHAQGSFARVLATTAGGGLTETEDPDD